MSKRDLRLLLLEDSAADAELVERELRKAGINFVSRRTLTREEFERELDEFQPDAILADYSLPSFDGLAALEIARSRRGDIPFLLVSGSLGEDRAVEALKAGATDYLVKGHLTRLAPALLRALQDNEERAGRRDLERQLQQAQKMEAIGQLAGGIAHDFNNLLTAIIGYSELILVRLPEDDPTVADVREIKGAGERAATLTRQLLAFSRKQIVDPRVLDLNAVVANMEKLLRRVIGEDIELRTVLAADLGRVKIDPGQVEQVVMNLAVNARDAMPRGGALVIETVNAELDEGYARTHVAVRPGPHVMLVVSDTGTGMDEATKARLFEPFFTTKTPGKGTGLGLATVYGIVKQAGGNIWVYSEPGHGTTFKVYLPRVDEAAEPLGLEPAGPPRGGFEVVLLVEDDAAVRALVREALGSYGYRVLEAADAEQALRLAEEHGAGIALLITDVVMPRTGGRELARRLTELRPDTKVLFLSGYTSDAILHHGILDRGVAFLQKPFTPEALARRVRQILDGGVKPSLSHSGPAAALPAEPAANEPPPDDASDIGEEDRRKG